jgi:AbrB family looped-hinge helix DNA binding protein
MTIAKVGEQYQIAIPDRVRETLGIKPGDSLDVKVIDGTVVLVPISVEAPSHADRLFGKHKALWSGEDAVAYIRKERESWRD